MTRRNILGMAFVRIDILYGLPMQCIAGGAVRERLKYYMNCNNNNKKKTSRSS